PHGHAPRNSTRYLRNPHPPKDQEKAPVKAIETEPESK
ncbi:MAG: hypothetical protein K0S28_518, partial [Paucimonas sp.]|nr:hypothetical protein [Paucimonas sp.]